MNFLEDEIITPSAIQVTGVFVLITLKQNVWWSNLFMIYYASSEIMKTNTGWIFSYDLIGEFLLQ
jgi:hypothetical protein